MNLRNVAAGALDLLATGIAHIAARLAVAEWMLEIHVNEGTEHFYPLRDGITHEPTEDCVCGPTEVLTQCEDHGDSWTWKHHPLTQKDVEEIP